MKRSIGFTIPIHRNNIVSPVAVEVSGGETVADIVQVVSRADRPPGLPVVKPLSGRTKTCFSFFFTLSIGCLRGFPPFCLRDFVLKFLKIYR